MCSNKDFVHLHNHSTYSIQDALPIPYELANAADDMGFPAIALTDHGKMSGIVDFVDACRKTQGKIKPIVGVELYTCKDMLDKTAPEGRKRPKHNHLTLLAQNETGYKNLLAMTSIAASEGYYYDPRVDHKILETHSDGVIALSGCLASEINQALLADDYQTAVEKAGWFKEIYKDRFFIELQYHKIEEQKHNLPLLVKIAKELDIPMVCSNDVHYIAQADWAIHDVLIQMRDLRENKQITPTGKKKAYETKQFYLKTYEQMAKIFGDKVPEALTNTMVINDMVEDYFQLDIPHLLPSVNIPKDKQFLQFKEQNLPHHKENDAYLAYLAFSGLKKLGLDGNKQYVSRLKKELSQIWYIGVSDYFLIHNEIIQYMKDSNIIYGIRGSGVGSLVNYCLEICPVDPIKWGLMFERFLNPGRGTQYDLEFPNVAPEKESEISNTDAIKKIRTIVKERMANIEGAEKQSANVSKELWLIENQELANYYLNLHEKGEKLSNLPNSWVAYYLGITDDPPNGELKVKKVGTLPDVDTDIDDTKRDQVIQWARHRFGEDKTMNIGAWGAYGAKASVLGALKTSERFNDRFKDKIHQEALKVTATIPKKPGTTIDSALETSSDFAYYYGRYQKEIDIAKELVGKISNLSVHAGGVIISSEPISQHAPVENSKGTLCSGYDMECVERVGLVKYDLLGLKTYQMIDLCRSLIKKRHDVDVNLHAIDFDDKNVYKLFKSGQTATVFQFGSTGMQDALKVVKASTMEDLIAVVSLYRPGPMEYIGEYAKRKLGEKEYTLAHELLDKHLGYTYGILIYQEQAMFLAREMAGLTWLEVDKLRKAISKKSSKDFQIMCEIFKKKSLARGVAEGIIDEVLHLIEKFGGYAFNRSHAASYAVLAYWTAYLRTYYPTEWIAACLEVDVNNDDAIKLYLKEASMLKIPVLYPDVNYSELTTAISENGEIILPLKFCKGAGDLAATVAENRPYNDFDDFMARSKSHKTIVKALAYGNAFKSFDDLKDMEPDEIIEYYDEKSKVAKRVSTRPPKRNIIHDAETVVRSWGADKFFEDF